MSTPDAEPVVRQPDILDDFVRETKRNTPSDYLAFFDLVRLYEARALRSGDDRAKAETIALAIVDAHRDTFSAVYTDAEDRVGGLVQRLYSGFLAGRFDNPRLRAEFDTRILPHLQTARSKLKIPKVPDRVEGYRIGDKTRPVMPPTDR